MRLVDHERQRVVAGVLPAYTREVARPRLQRRRPEGVGGGPHLHDHGVQPALLRRTTSSGRSTSTTEIVITGGETDVCVLATMLGAIDWGFRAILVTDALCSSADETHDAMMNVYMNRFGEQVECVTTKTLLESWSGRARAAWAS